MVVVGVLNMGEFSPSLVTILGNIKASLASQFPSVLLFLGDALNRKHESIEQVWDGFEGAKDNTTPAAHAGHLSSRPILSYQTRTANSKPRVMSVADNNMYDVLDNAHEVDFEDENEWNQVYAIGQGSSFRPKLPKLFKYEFDSDESKVARRRIGQRCMNCASEEHFLRACDREYVNHFDQFTPEFGAGSTAEVNERWKVVKGRMRRKHAHIGPSKGSQSP